MKLSACKSRIKNSAKPRLLSLEDRLTPAGFGPDDGAAIVESWPGYYREVKIQPGNQSIVAVGTSNGGVAISRHDSLGNADTAFGSGGTAMPALGANSESGQGLVIQPDGKMIVSGEVTGNSNLQHFVARFKSNGALDSSFGSGGWNSVDVQTMDYLAFTPTTVGLQSSGKVVIAGSSWGTKPGYPANSNPAVLARFTASGSVDSGRSGFGTVVHNNAIGYTLSTLALTWDDVVVQPDDKIVVVAASDGGNGFLVGRYTVDGTLDNSFSGSGYTTFLPAGSVKANARAIALQADGKLVVVGSCTEIGAAVGSPSDMFVARFNANGSVDTSFGGGAGFVTLDIDGNASATFEISRNLVIQPDGKIVVAGQEYAAGASAENVLVARINPDGSPDSTFGSGGFKIQSPAPGSYYVPWNVAVQGNGNIIVAGSQSGHPFLMRFFGGAPLMAAGAPSSVNTQAITKSQVQPLLNEALFRWQTAGANVSALQGVNVRIADLGGSTLGLASGNTIWLDNNAAGHGWFVDPTPGNDSEFTTRGNQGEQHKIDLLTTLVHEVGHLLGHDHAGDAVTQESLREGVRPTLHGAYVGDADRDDILSPWR